MKTVLLGDIGGQFGVLQDMLRRLGIGADRKVPEGMIVIQVGDVVRMADDDNLDSYACAKLIDELLRTNPGTWIQMLGNHESPFMNGPYPAFWVERKAFQTCHDIVNAWWNEGLVKLAAGFDLPDGHHILTHAGITKGYHDTLGNPAVPDMVTAINSIVGTNYSEVAHTGLVTFFDEPSLSADFLWASSSAEIIPSWDGHEMGFHQIHGHDTPLLSWEEPTPRYDMPTGWSIDIDVATRLSTIHTPHGHRIHTCDWVLKETVNPDSSAWGLMEIDAIPFF